MNICLYFYLGSEDLVQHSMNFSCFYLGTEDIVQCFQCGLKLKNWDKSDNPWREHARHSNKCPYLINSKGKEYCRFVLEVRQT